MYNHRGQPTGTNHRPTPRLARTMSEHINRVTMESGWDEILGSVSPSEMQGHINDYRKERNVGSPEIAKGLSESISDSFSNRKKNRDFDNDRKTKLS
jgi:hypothetical protein